MIPKEEKKEKKKNTCPGVHLELSADWRGSECLKGETRQRFDIPFLKNKLETDIT